LPGSPVAPYTTLFRSLFRNFNATDVIRNNIIVTNQVSPLAKIFENCTNLSVENSLFLFTNTATGVSLSGNGITFNNCLSYSYPRSEEHTSELQSRENL